MINIKLKYNKGFKWYQLKETYVKGYLYNEKNKLYQGEDLALHIAKKSHDEIEKLIPNYKGLFTILKKNDGIVYLYSDITRTFPIFYGRINGNYTISDSANLLCTTEEIINKNLFLATGYVVGNKTLLFGVHQLEAGQIVKINNQKVEKKFYFNYLLNKKREENFKDLYLEAKDILENVIKKLIRSSNGRQIVIPLSGGYDSRIIAVLLKKFDYANIVCFTYGKKNSIEVDISERIAKKLRFKWYFVEYSDELLEQSLNRRSFQDYVKYASNYSSVAHIQDFFAVQELKKSNFIEKEAIFVPGHSGDLFAGTHISKDINKKSSFTNLLEQVVLKHHSLTSLYGFDITNEIINFFHESAVPYYSQMEAWSVKERQSKFIVNSNRVYEFFGYEHRIPLWDIELASFFKNIPWKHKNRSNKIKYILYRKNLYDSLVMSYFKEYDVEYKKTGFRFIINRIKNIIFKNNPDMNNFTKIISVISNHSESENINYLIGLYYFNLLQQEKNLS